MLLFKSIDDKVLNKIIKSILSAFKDKKNDNLVYTLYKPKFMKKSSYIVEKLLVIS